MAGFVTQSALLKEAIAVAHGIPPELFTSVIHVGDFDDSQDEMVRVAESLQEAYKVNQDWDNAVELFGRAEFGGNSDTFINDVLYPGGAKGGVSGEPGFFEKTWDKISSPFGAVKNIWGSGFMVVGGLILIVIALLSVKPVRDAAKVAVTKGVAK